MEHSLADFLSLLIILVTLLNLGVASVSAFHIELESCYSGYNPEAPALSASAVMPPVQSTVPIGSVDFSVPPPTIQYSTPSWGPTAYPTSSANVLVQPSAPYDPIQPSTTVPITSTAVVQVRIKAFFLKFLQFEKGLFIVK